MPDQIDPAEPQAETMSPTEAPAVSESGSAPVEYGTGVWLHLSAGDRWFLLISAVVMLALMGLHAWQLSSGGRETVEISRLSGQEYQFQLEINSATWVEWMQLEQIGEVTARRIVEDRETNGPFRSIDELERVDGIGAKTVERLRPFLRLEQPPTDP